MKEYALSFNKLLLSSMSPVPVPSYPPQDALARLKGRSPKKLESLIEVPNIVHVKEQVLSFIIILTPLQ